MSRIIQIDSNYVNKVIYPLDTDFIIPVNGTPPVSTYVADNRSVYYTYNYIYSRFLWIGNISLPEYSDVSNNAIKLFFFPIDSTHVFVFLNDIEPPPEVSAVYSFKKYVEAIQLSNDYFVGCIFIHQSFSSLISEFSGNTGIITLDQPINFDSSSTQSCYIFNPSYTFKNTFVFLGSNRFQKQTAPEFLLYTGLNLSDVIINVRNFIIFPISNFIQNSRSMILNEDITDYLSNDLFLVRPTSIGNKNSIRIVKNTIPQFKSQGIMNFVLENRGRGYQIGEILKISNTIDAEFLVDRLDSDNNIMNIFLLYPGDGFFVGKYSLEGGSGDGATIVVKEISPYFEILNFEEFDILNDQYLIMFPCFKIWTSVLYFLFKKKINQIIYFETDTDQISELNNGDYYYNDFGYAFYVEFIQFFTIFPNINIPLVQYTPKCFEVEISTISLPNLPVCGYNLLLADFPYLLVTITNATNMDIANGNVNSTITSGGMNYGSIYSNNPNLIRSTFICPIANIKNPDIIKFVVVNSNQRMVLKINPSDSLRFTVQLPNGRVLTFIREQACELKPVTLNKIYHNSKRVYALDFKRQQVAITFTLTPL